MDTSVKKLLTISIAGYNVEAYIGPTLEKLSCCKCRNALEILVIDDGGADGTLSIAQEYAARFPDVFIPVHKENGGWGSTVNTAVRMARGCYLKLLDGDDYFDPEGLEELVEALKGTAADLVYTPVMEFDDVTGDPIRIQPLAKEYPRGTTLEIRALKGELGISMHGCAFRTEMLWEKQVLLTEHCFYADFEYLVKGLGGCSTVCFLEKPVYYYRLGREGQSVSMEGRRKHYRDQIRIMKAVAEYGKNSLPAGDDRRELVCSYISLYADNTLIAMTELGERKDARKLYQILRKRYPDVYRPVRKKAKAYIAVDFLPALAYKISDRAGTAPAVTGD